MRPLVEPVARDGLQRSDVLVVATHLRREEDAAVRSPARLQNRAPCATRGVRIDRRGHACDVGDVPTVRRYAYDVPPRVLRKRSTASRRTRTARCDDVAAIRAPRDVHILARLAGETLGVPACRADPPDVPARRVVPRGKRDPPTVRRPRRRKLLQPGVADACVLASE